MERISGPYGPQDRYFIAAYTVQSDGGYFGFAKLCDNQPDDVWLCQAVDKVGAGPVSSEHAALEAAEHKARQELELMRRQSDWLGLA